MPSVLKVRGQSPADGMVSAIAMRYDGTWRKRPLRFFRGSYVGPRVASVPVQSLLPFGRFSLVARRIFVLRLVVFPAVIARK